MSDEIRLTNRQREEMLAHILACLPEEGCGLLGGRGSQAEVVIAVANALHSPVRFEMDANEQVQAMLALERQGLEIVAIFHSHPAGPPYPSITDLRENAYPDAASLIWYPDGEAWQVKAFRLVEHVFEEIPVVWTAL